MYGRRRRRQDAGAALLAQAAALVVPEAQAGPARPSRSVREVAAERLRRYPPTEPAWLDDLFPLPDRGTAPPGTVNFEEIQDLEDAFAAGEMTWAEYSARLKRVTSNE